jgi:hypothetical protein
MDLLEKAQKLAKEWHEAGRNYFEQAYPVLDYDNYAPKKVIEKRKYINLDEGNSGAFLIDKTDGLVYRIKSAYGVPNKKKCLGHINVVTGDKLNHYRWY